MLVTSRYQGYEGKVDLAPEFVRFEVQPLDEVQAGTFVHRWFRVAYERLDLEPDAAKEKARRLPKARCLRPQSRRLVRRMFRFRATQGPLSASRIPPACPAGFVRWAEWLA